MADFNFNDENNPIAVLKMPILVGILVIVLVIIAGMAYLKPALETYSTTNSEYKTTLQNYNAKLQELDDLKASAELANSPKENAENTALEKEFFKPMEAGSDPDVILAGEFNEILSLMIANKIKTRSVDYDYEPKDDPFYKRFV